MGPFRHSSPYVFFRDQNSTFSLEATVGKTVFIFSCAIFNVRTAIEIQTEVGSKLNSSITLEI